jgi:D-alanyl-D-alanine carboxypeptidase/D-alanyl-D-alanine-endopeptidase (penicillin-binding protein 4)
MRLNRAALVLMLSMPPCAWANSATGIPTPVAQVMAAQGLPTSAVSVAVLDLGSGRLVLSENPDTPRSPASTIKVVTTFAALDLLGPAYTWHTQASISGEIDGGVLNGDI